MKKQTSVEWLVDNLKEVLPEVEQYALIIGLSKQMEKEQAQKYAEFAIHCDRNDFPIIEFDAYMNLSTFKSE